MEKDFLRQSEDFIRDKVLKKYMMKESELEILEGRLEDLLLVVKNRNPWLFLMIQNAFKEKS
jgi:hypothetical protein